MFKKLIFLFFIKNIFALNFLTDFNFVQNFTDNLKNKNYYQFENNNKNKIELLKNIFFDIQNLFSNNNIINNNDETHFRELIKKLQDHKYKNYNYNQTNDLMSSLFLIKIEEQIINTNVKLLMTVMDHDVNFIGLKDFCIHAINITRSFISKNYYLEKIVDEYNNLLVGISVQMMKEEWNNFCGKTSSLRFGIYDYYKTVMKNYLKIFGVFYYSWIINGWCTRTDPRQAINNSKTKFLDNFKKTIKSTKLIIHEIKHYQYLCPETHYEKLFENKHVELKHLVQKMIISEQNLTSSGTCANNCQLGANEFIQNGGTECDLIKDCEYLSSYFEICEVEDDGRRYKWFKDGNGRNYGQNGNCYGKRTEVYSKYSWSEIRYCDYCVCTCINWAPRGHSVTAISLKEQVSDIANNWIMVGVRFVESGHMVHVEILEGLVQPYGKINDTRWREIKKFDEEFDGFGNMEVGRDYERAERIYLHDVMAPLGYLVTGVRFRLTEDNLETPKRRRGTIQLQIHVTKFDFLTGILVIENSYWIPANLNLKGQLVQKNLDDRTKVPEDLQHVTSDVTVQFEASDLLKDAGQSTIPFFDGRDLEFSPSAPLQGLGLFHRSHEGFSGYLAFRAFDFDMSLVFSDV